MTHTELLNLERCEARIAELETQNAWLQAQLDAANKAFGHTTEDETAWCEVCNLPAEHCRENHASGSDYAEGCKP